MAEYKVTKVSQQEPRKWHNDKFNSDTYYIKVMLEGVERPVEIGKKTPDALKVDDIVYGTIQPKPDYEADSFKAEQKPFNGGGKSNYQPRDDEAIRAQWAIGQAVGIWNAIITEKEKDDREKWEKVVEYTAQKLYAMVDRVKGSNGKSEQDF